MVHAMQSIGSHRVPVSPLVANKLYKSVVMPKLLYGMEAMHVGQEENQEMESFQIESAKLLQGLPKQTANAGGMTTIGWNSVQAGHRYCETTILLESTIATNDKHI